MNILEVKNLEVSFRTKLGLLKATRNISYDIPAKKTLGIIGESGCGKTVTSLAIMGLVEPPGHVNGDLIFQDQNLSEISKKEYEHIRGNKISMVFQEPMTAFNPVLKIGKQIDEQLLAHTSLTKQEVKEKTIELLHKMGISSPKERYHYYPYQLSGGMRQRAMIAMALSCDPDLLIADEPTTALDVTIQAQILELFQNLQEEMNMSIQFITHDLGVIAQVSHKILVMYAGSICEYGERDEILKHPQHPYTVALFESIPHINKSVSRLSTIPGQVPSLLTTPKGCPYSNRCAKAQKRCHEEKPSLEGADTHQVSCFYPEAK